MWRRLIIHDCHIHPNWGLIMTRITAHLPMPISINALWRSNRGKVHRSKAYMAWLQQAGQEWLLQKKNQPQTISGRFSAQIILARPNDKRRRDLDNFSTKAILDLCKVHGLIDDDYLCEKLYIRWGTSKEAPSGARLILKKL